MKNKRIFELAQRIHEMLCEHAAAFGESEATCVVRIAGNLWTDSPKACESEIPSSSGDSRFPSVA